MKTGADKSIGDKVDVKNMQKKVRIYVATYVAM